MGDGSRRSVVRHTMRKKLECAIEACSNGVPRVHIVCGTMPGRILEEVFTGSGSGTMVVASLEEHEVITRGDRCDLQRVSELFELCGFSAPSDKNREELLVLLDDDEVVGALRLRVEGGCAFLSRICSSEHALFDEVAGRLIESATSISKSSGATHVIIRPEDSQDWILVSPVLNYRDSPWQFEEHVGWILGL